jgi:hypothetical protein
MAKKNPETTKLIVSYATEMIGTRFRVKVSNFDNGVQAPSFMIATQDLLDGGFSLKFFKNTESVAQFLNLLKAAIK